MSSSPDLPPPADESPGSVTPSPKKPWPRWVKPALWVGGGVLVATGAVFAALFWATQQVSQEVVKWVEPQNPATASQKAQAFLNVKPQGAFVVRQSISVPLCCNVARLRHRPSQQEFFWISGLDAETTREVFGETLTPPLVESMAQSFVKLKNAQNPQASTEPLHVEAVETLEESTLVAGGKTLPYKRLQIAFRYGEAGTLRRYQGTVGQLPQADGRHALILSYGREKAYHPELFKTLLEEVSPKASVAARANNP